MASPERLSSPERRATSPDRGPDWTSIGPGRVFFDRRTTSPESYKAVGGFVSERASFERRMASPERSPPLRLANPISSLESFKPVVGGVVGERASFGRAASPEREFKAPDRLPPPPPLIIPKSEPVDCEACTADEFCRLHNLKKLFPSLGIHPSTSNAELASGGLSVLPFGFTTIPQICALLRLYHYSIPLVAFWPVVPLSLLPVPARKLLVCLLRRLSPLPYPSPTRNFDLLLILFLNLYTKLCNLAKLGQWTQKT